MIIIYVKNNYQFDNNFLYTETNNYHLQKNVVLI